MSEPISVHEIVRTIQQALQKAPLSLDSEGGPDETSNFVGPLNFNITQAQFLNIPPLLKEQAKFYAAWDEDTNKEDDRTGYYTMTVFIVRLNEIDYWQTNQSRVELKPHLKISQLTYRLRRKDEVEDDKIEFLLALSDIAQDIFTNAYIPLAVSIGYAEPAEGSRTAYYRTLTINGQVQLMRFRVSKAEDSATNPVNEDGVFHIESKLSEFQLSEAKASPGLVEACALLNEGQVMFYETYLAETVGAYLEDNEKVADQLEELIQKVEEDAIAEAKTFGIELTHHDLE
jgi:hypothetical protein